jgi:MFS family permease
MSDLTDNTRTTEGTGNTGGASGTTGQAGTLTYVTGRWYEGVTRYQWLVLLIASAGWVFDVYEGQIFNITRDDLLSDVLGVARDAPEVKYYGDVFLGIFLAGGTLGGIAFGSLADRWGRRPVMMLTIVCYSVFSGLTFFADSLWQAAVLRFLVAVGVGGEWAVAAALVSEVFPPKARAQASGIFHDSSILGTWLAALAGIAVGSEWRYAYLVGVLPALLIVWIRSSMEEPAAWSDRKSTGDGGAARGGSLVELLGDPRWRTRAVAGMLLAAVGLGAFWGVTVAGQKLAEQRLLADGVSPVAAQQQAKFAYGIVQAAGGGVGLLAFGPLCARFGRRRAFIVAHLLALVIVPITCYVPASYNQLLLLLPVFGGLTLGMHAGYAIYFPELFPAHLRATGAGFCFNGGRIVSSLVLLLSAELKAVLDLHLAVTLLSLIFLFGFIVIRFLPETKDQPLPA